MSIFNRILKSAAKIGLIYGLEKEFRNLQPFTSYLQENRMKTDYPTSIPVQINFRNNRFHYGDLFNTD